MESYKLRHEKLIIILIFVVFTAIIFPLRCFAAAETVELNADKIIYDDMSGTATAEGNAVMTHGDVKVYAERIDYDDDAGKVVASSNPDVGVILTNNQQVLGGDRLMYDVNTSEGVMTGAKATLATEGKPIYVHGDNLEAIPYELALEKKIIKSKNRLGSDYVIKWDNVSMTTCTLDHPHYRLESKKFVFIPKRRIIVKRPRFYLGDKYIFTYPFDYLLNVNRERRVRATILPDISFESSKGTGIGFGGPIAWESGSLDFDLLYWSDIGLEWNMGLEQSIGRGLTFGGNLKYSWDEMWDEKKFRPSLFLNYSWPGWFARLNWSKNQYQELQKWAEYQYRGELETSPELVVGTSWRQNGSIWYRFAATWGRYRASLVQQNITEVEPWQNRLKFNTGGYWESDFGAVTPFLNLDASTMFYDENDMRQSVVNSIWGLRYNFGRVKLGTAYLKRWASGETPMDWDREWENEILYQNFEIPFGKYLSLNVLGGYDMNASFVEEMNYTLRYLNDCMIWELSYRNDRNVGGDNKVFFRVGFLGTSVDFANDAIYNPFAAPVTVPRKSSQ